jgi:hypothetical protein
MNLIQRDINDIPGSNSKIIHTPIVQIPVNISPILKKENQ